MKARQVIASPELYRWERRILIAGSLAPLLFIPTLDGPLFANSGSLPCAAALIVEYLLAQKVQDKYRKNIARAEQGWFALPSEESQSLHLKCLLLGLYGVLLWGFGSYPLSWLASLLR